MRRNLLIAEALTRMPGGADVLLITGAMEAQGLVSSSGIDTISLPALYKSGNGHYRPRFFSFGLKELIAMRSRIILGALETFRPDVLIVDKVADGVKGELRESLDYLRSRTSTRCVLGLRDILDDPDTIKQEWADSGFFQNVDRYYDDIWIYGDRRVYDVAGAYGLPDRVRDRIRYTGYLDQGKRLSFVPEPVKGFTEDLVPHAPYFVCTVGGGQDGYRVAEHFLRATFPAGKEGIILTGPFMNPEEVERLQNLCSTCPWLHLMQRLAEPTLLYQYAEGVVCMGGYNTIGEVLALKKPALVIPRVQPRKEQWIRAERLAELGLVDVLHPDAATPAAVTRWLAHPTPPKEEAKAMIRFSGLDRILSMVQRLMPVSHSISNPSVYAS